MSEEIYDVVIIGAGPAGLTAGLYASRLNNKTLILEGNKVGGKTLDAHWVENYPGFPEGISGTDLVNLMEKQCASLGQKSDRKQSSVLAILET